MGAAMECETGIGKRFGAISRRIPEACLSLCIATLSPVVSAAERDAGWTLDVNGLSRHMESHYTDSGRTYHYNQTNNGLGASIEWDGWRRWLDEPVLDVDVTFGFYENSYDDTSFYVGTFVHREFSHGDWIVAPGIKVLLLSGYDDSPQDAPAVFPLPLLGVEFGHRALKLHLGVLPFGEVPVATLQLQVAPGRW